MLGDLNYNCRRIYLDVILQIAYYAACIDISLALGKPAVMHDVRTGFSETSISTFM